MRRARSLHRLAAAAALLALSRPGGARADGPGQAEIDAQALYDRAMVVLAQRRYEAACPMFEEVVRLAPASNAAKVAVAECHVRAGRPATALTLYAPIEADAVAKGEWTRVAQVRARLESLRARVPLLVLTVPAPVTALPGLEIHLGGALLDPSTLDAPMPLDPGSYALEVTATGRSRLSATLEIAKEGETTSKAVAMPNELHPPRLAWPEAAPAARPSAVRGSAIPGIVAVSAGATALGIGAVTGVMTLTSARALKSTCEGNLCPPSQQATGQQVGALATVSTAELVVGAAVAAAGITLLVVRPFGREAPAVTVGSGFVGLLGRF